MSEMAAYEKEPHPIILPVAEAAIGRPRGRPRSV